MSGAPFGGRAPARPGQPRAVLMASSPPSYSVGFAWPATLWPTGRSSLRGPTAGFSPGARRLFEVPRVLRAYAWRQARRAQATGGTIYESRRVWKRLGSGKPQQSAVADCGRSLTTRIERQVAVDRSTCSRLTSRRSPVRAGHHPSLRSPLQKRNVRNRTGSPTCRARSCGSVVEAPEWVLRPSVFDRTRASLCRREGDAHADDGRAVATTLRSARPPCDGEARASRECSGSFSCVSYVASVSRPQAQALAAGSGSVAGWALGAGSASK